MVAEALCTKGDFCSVTKSSTREQRFGSITGEYGACREINFFHADVFDSTAIENPVTLPLGQVAFGGTLVEQQHDWNAHRSCDVHGPSIIGDKDRKASLRCSYLWDGQLVEDDSCRWKS